MNTKLKSDPVKLLCTLAEEVGHHFTSARSNILFRDRPYKSLKELLTLSIDELRAKVWAVNFLVSDKEFIQFIANLHYTDAELASHFGVLENFVNLKQQLLGI